MDPRGRASFRSNPGLVCPEQYPDRDVSARNDGYVTVTPLPFDLTHDVLLRRMGDWEWRL